MKVVIPINDDRFKQQTDPGSWEVALDIHGNTIPSKAPLTAAARKHWREYRGSSMFGFVDFSGLSEEDVMSVLSAAQRGDVRTSKNHFGDISSYKVVAA